MAKKTDKTEGRIVAVEEALGKTEQFIENNSKAITIAVAIIVVIILGYFGLKKFYFGPLEEDAQAQMFYAEKYFGADSLDLAMLGDGNHLGFIDIVDEFKMTKSANLSRYYLGLCYLKKGEFEEALKQLKKFKKRDKLVAPMATGAMGDAYFELGETKKALNHYIEAAEMNNNIFTSPVFLMKAAETCEVLGKYEQAVELYERIKKDFNKSFEGREFEKDELDKSIARAKGMTKK